RRDARQRRDAGTHRLAVDVDRAGAALAEPAAEARPLEPEIVAQHVEQRHLGVVDGDGDRPAVDVEGLPLGHGRTPRLRPALRRSFLWLKFSSGPGPTPYVAARHVAALHAAAGRRPRELAYGFPAAPKSGSGDVENSRNPHFRSQSRSLQ